MQQTENRQIVQSNRLAKLKSELAAAQQVAAIAKKELSKTKRKFERADDVCAALQEEVDLEELRLWGNTPDVTALLDGKRGMVFYRALNALVESKGLSCGGEWHDTKQHVLHFSLNRGEIGAVDRIAAELRYFASAMKAVKGGWARFNVNHQQPESGSWNLFYSPKRKDAELVKYIYGSESEKHAFSTLEDALRYVEENLWLESIFDQALDALPAHVVNG